MPSVAGAADPEAAVMKTRYDEHAAVLWRHALRLTGDANRAEDVVQETPALDRLLIADAMTQLSAEHRAVVDRCSYRGWTTTQIAADLGIADGTVKSRLHYAVRALRSRCRRWG